MGGAAIRVQDLELGGRKRQLSMLMLAVESQQLPTKGFQVGGRGGAAGNEGAGTTARRNAPAKHHFIGPIRQPLGDLRHLGLVEQILGKVEDPLDPGLLGPRPDDLGTRLAAHQQIERMGKHGLSRSRLAGNCIEPFTKPQLRPLDQEQVLDSQLAEHALCLAPGAAGPVTCRGPTTPCGR